MPDQKGDLPLHDAAFNGHEGCIRKLILHSGGNIEFHIRQMGILISLLNQNFISR